MERLCGIDSSTSCTSISLFEDEKFIDYRLIEMNKKELPDKWQRINPMIAGIYDVLKEWKPDVVYQEDTYAQLNKNIDTLKCLTSILGSVRGWCVDNGVEYYNLTPNAWRAKVGFDTHKVKRPEIKDKTMEFVKEKYGIEVPTDDVSDSVCIGIAGTKIRRL